MTEGRCRAPRWHITCCMSSKRTTPCDLFARVGVVVNAEIAIGLMAKINFVSN